MSQVGAALFAKTCTTHRSPGDLDSAAARSGQEITWLVDAVADITSTASLQYPAEPVSCGPGWQMRELLVEIRSAARRRSATTPTH